MKRILGRVPALLLVFGLAPCALRSTAHAQAGAVPYNPRETFAPFTFPQPASRYRSADGTPGPDYWQNRADYEIRARLDPASQQLSGSEVITYTNHSPTALDYLWLQLDQNTYRPDARSHSAEPHPRKGFTAGFVLDRVETEQGGGLEKAATVVSDTRLQIRLVHPVSAAGGQIRLHLTYHYTIPGKFGGRTAHAATRNGEIFDIAQWYPRLAVYDDVNGWDTLPYLAQEFHLEYGAFDYFVTVPWDLLVAGSGELQNPQEVLTAAERRRLDQARGSDQTVMIRPEAEIGDAASRPVDHGELTWHFRMDHTRDVSFAASRAFIWDAARIRLPEGRSTLAMSFYPAESAGNEAWGRSTEYLKHAVEEFSRRWSVYPYPAAINVGGPVSGMEYPGLLFDGMADKGRALFWVTAHEIGHTWFPMVVGFDERRHAWMDEGFNTFIDIYESDAFSGGVYGPKRDTEYAPGTGTPADQIAAIIADPAAPPLLTTADEIPEKYRHPITYFKSAEGLILLREQILGPERFDWAFRKFIRDWSYRHPTPSDFFRAMDSAGGEDLSWFWRGWYQNNWSLDLAVRDVRYTQGDFRRGADLTIANLGRLVLPATVQVDFRDGGNLRLQLPAETWIQQTTAMVHVDSTQPIATVTIDPDHAIPDGDRSNNVFRVAPSERPGPP